jgi:hypothetical protein
MSLLCSTCGLSTMIDYYFSKVLLISWLFYIETLPVFFESVVVASQHEAFLYVLPRRLRPQNMARIRVSSFRDQGTP